MKLSPRSVARYAAIQASFQFLIYPLLAVCDVIQEFTDVRFDKNKYDLFDEEYYSIDLSLFDLIVNGVSNHQKELDEAIACALPTHWDINRLEKTSRCILRCAVFELKYCPEVPHEVILNEYITTAHSFLLDKGAAFINGVLDTVSKRLKKS
jgi:N utilization substance protein B